MPWTRPVIFGNWALPAEYLAIGAEVGDLVGDATVKAPAGDRHRWPTHATARWSTSSQTPVITLPSIEKRIREAGPVMRFLLEVNFARLDRTQQPRPPEYRLVWTHGPAPAGLPAWSTDSPWTAPATVFLEPITN